jgi:hypothetical protein
VSAGTPFGNGPYRLGVERAYYRSESTRVPEADRRAVSISAALWESKAALVRSFHTATIYGMLNTWRRCDLLRTRPQEPDFVAGLVVESAPLLHAALAAVLTRSGVSVSMSAVFCHQTPRVEFGLPRVACELGDLLYVFVHTARDGRVWRNALLFQAKCSANQPYVVATSDADQLRLYTDWPEFEYTNSSYLNGQSRAVTPKSPHAGAQYLLIDDRSLLDPMSGLLNLPGTYPVGCCVPDLRLRDHNDLASELFDLLIFRTGRPFDDRLGLDDWSRVVWDLLESAVRKAFNRKNSGYRNAPRALGEALEQLDGFSFSAATSEPSTRTVADILGGPTAARRFYTSADDPPGARVRQDEGGERDAGVSVLLVETSELEGER